MLCCVRVCVLWRASLLRRACVCASASRSTLACALWRDAAISALICRHCSCLRQQVIVDSTLWMDAAPTCRRGATSMRVIAEARGVCCRLHCAVALSLNIACCLHLCLYVCVCVCAFHKHCILVWWWCYAARARQHRVLLGWRSSCVCVCVCSSHNSHDSSAKCRL